METVIPVTGISYLHCISQNVAPQPHSTWGGGYKGPQGMDLLFPSQVEPKLQGSIAAEGKGG